MSDRVDLLAIRHAPVDVVDVCYGRTDVPTLLSVDDVVTRVSGAVEDFAPGTIWSSDAIRCHGPAAAIAARLEVDHRVEPRVREFFYGRWEGRPWSEIPQDELDLWMDDWRLRAPPGGERVADLAARVASWWADLAPGRHFLLAHAGVVHGLDVAVKGLSWEESLDRRADFLEARRFTRG